LATFHTAFRFYGVSLGWSLVSVALALYFGLVLQFPLSAAATDPSAEKFVQLGIFLFIGAVVAKIAHKKYTESALFPHRHVHYVMNDDDDNGGGGRTATFRPLLEAGDDQGDHGDEDGVEGSINNGGAMVAVVPSRQALYPSGLWRGYYLQGSSEHGVAEFTLNFTTDSIADHDRNGYHASGGNGRIRGGSGGDMGEVSGEGVDGVGSYTIFGRVSQSNGRVSFTKQYRRGSANAQGIVLNNGSNMGHAVEYRGGPAALTSSGRASLGSGLRGEWSLHAGGRDSGRWHLWPIMDEWNADDEEGDSETEGSQAGDGGKRGSGGGSGGSGGGQPEEGECCVCFDKAINTRLEPCGHVALCSVCANRLNPRLCPLCRAPIAMVRDARTSRQRSRSGKEAPRASGLADKKSD
jgi:hypothetical protein